MDTRSIESKPKPADLVAKISADYSSFAQEMDGRPHPHAGGSLVTSSTKNRS